jgi:hypothetical protein
MYSPFSLYDLAKLLMDRVSSGHYSEYCSVGIDWRSQECSSRPGSFARSPVVTLLNPNSLVPDFVPLHRSNVLFQHSCMTEVFADHSISMTEVAS